MTRRIAQYVFTDDEYRQLLDQRALMDAQLALEHGQEWVDAHKVMLDAQWEAAISMGLFDLEDS